MVDYNIYNPYNYTSTSWIDCKFPNGIYTGSVANTYYHQAEGFSIRVQVLDVNGNAIQNADVRIYDRYGNPDIFLPIITGGVWVYPTSAMNGEAYGVMSTSFSVNNATDIAIGDIIRYHQEVMRVDNKVGNLLTVTRGHYSTYPIVHNYSNAYDPIEKMQTSILTDVTGWIKRLILYTKDYKGLLVNIARQPFTMIVKKIGYEPEKKAFNLTERTTWTITLQPARMKFR
jgi:hypothetical protein